MRKPKNKTMTIDGRAHFTSPPGITKLRKGDSITIDLLKDGFHSGASIDTVKIFKNNANNLPGREICSWTRTGSNQCRKLFDIAAQSATQVTITDVESTDTAVAYWFSVSGTRGAVPTWGVDPELINRPGT